MRVGLIEAANDAFKSSPGELRNTPVPDPLGRHGNFGVQLCPAKPKAREVLLRDSVLWIFNYVNNTFSKFICIFDRTEISVFPIGYPLTD